MPTSSACISSANNGHCPFPAESYIIGANGNPYVDQNVWNASSTYHQTLYATSPDDWYVTANANTGWGGVQTFPNTGFNMTGTVDGYATTTSSWNVTIPTDNTQTAGWAAYDLWFNNWADEVMIQTDLTANNSLRLHGRSRDHLWRHALALVRLRHRAGLETRYG